MGSVVIKRKIKRKQEQDNILRTHFIHFGAVKRSSTAPFKGKDGAERGGVLFNSAS